VTRAAASKGGRSDKKLEETKSMFAPPEVIEAEVLAVLPDEFRRVNQPTPAAARRGGKPIHSFFEGPSFDRDGNLYVTTSRSAAFSASRRTGNSPSLPSTTASRTG
jgi:hypothetical protein